MFTRILCPTDHSEHSRKALRLAIDLASKYQAALVILHVMQRDQDQRELARLAEVEGLAAHVNTELKRLQSMDDRIDLVADPNLADRGISPRVLVELGQRILDEARDDCAEAGLTGVETRLDDGNPAECVLHCVERDAIDCVVMGSRGLSDLRGLFLGSVSHKVANRARCTCILVK